MQGVPKPVVLAILDGFGIARATRGNAIRAARAPHLTTIEQYFPFTALQASGVAVGLPWGEVGNSEVGHMTIGAGRVLYQHLVRILNALEDGSFHKNSAFLKVIAHAKAKGSAIHLLGLVSTGSVHSSLEHLYALLDLVAEPDSPKAYLHVITDGRDAPLEEAGALVAELQAKIAARYPTAAIASLIGRFYAMDRDQQWDRVQKTYELLTSARGIPFTDPADYLRQSYRRGTSDEFIEPACLGRDGAPVGRIKAGDGLIMFNFREDSMREMASAFAERDFTAFSRESVPNLAIATMTEYKAGLPGVLVAFPPLAVDWPLARVLAEAGKTQLHVAESEKYAHVTYFFNGGRDAPFPNEERIAIPSLGMPHFDDHPEMKAPEITETVTENLDRYDFIIANYANADMVGHTGKFQAAVNAIEALDVAIGRLSEEILKRSGVLLVTADHGNAEQKIHPQSGEPVTEHTGNPVPFYLIGASYRRRNTRSVEEIEAEKRSVRGILTDVAPTILELMHLKKPEPMTGKSLLSILTP